MQSHMQNASSPWTVILNAFVAEHRQVLWTVLLYASGLGVLALATPVAVQALVNSAAFGALLQPIVVLAGVVFSVLVAMGVLKALKAWAVEVLQRRIFVDGVARLAYVLPRLDGDARREHALPEPTHRYFELFVIQKAVASLLLGAVDAILTTGVGLLVLAFYHPVLLGFDFVLIAAIAFILFALGRGGVRSALSESSAKYALSSFLAEVERARLAFRDHAGEAFAHAQIDVLSTRYLTARGAHYRVVFRQLTGALATQALASAGVLGLGGLLVLERELTLGQLVAAELIVTAVVAALSELPKHLETYYDLCASLTKLGQADALPTERDSDHPGDALPSGALQLELHALSLRAQDRVLLEDASLRLRSGGCTLLVGPPASGKTRFLEALYGVLPVHKGAMLLNGVDTRLISRDALRERVGVVLGPELIPATVIDNVRMGRHDVGGGAVEVLLESLGLLEELERLPDGLETLIGNGGAALTYSQAYRLTLARTLLRMPGLLALDADLWSMEPQAVQAVLRAVRRPGAPWTLLLVGRPEQLPLSGGDHDLVRIEDGQLTLVPTSGGPA